MTTTNIPDVVASDEVLAGLRDELAKANALATGESYPRCEVEILRMDEGSEGISSVAGQPAARATRSGVVARAWIIRSKGGPRERDTGDVRSVDTTSVAPDARTATFQQLDTLRAAARKTGHRIGTRILGLPSATE